jgi:hypothetical protein
MLWGRRVGPFLLQIHRSPRDVFGFRPPSGPAAHVLFFFSSNRIVGRGHVATCVLVYLRPSDVSGQSACVCLWNLQLCLWRGVARKPRCAPPRARCTSSDTQSNVSDHNLETCTMTRDAYVTQRYVRRTVPHMRRRIEPPVARGRPTVHAVSHADRTHEPLPQRAAHQGAARKPQDRVERATAPLTLEGAHVTIA